MKKIVILFISVLFINFGFSQQSQNLTISGAIVSPDPTGVGFSEQMCFNFNAVNGATLEPGETIDFVVIFNKVSQGSIENMQITSPSYISWMYNTATQSWEGEINSDLGILTTALVCFDGLVVNEEATIAEAGNEEGVGFRVEMTPHALDPAGMEVDDFTFDYTFTDQILPIQLGDLTVVASNADAVLEWNTLTEINNSHFEVERSFDGASWTFVERIESKSEQGHSNEELIYNYTDKEVAVFSDQVYYRVKQIDLGGDDAPFSFTPIRLITFDEELQIATKIFPNPVQSGTPVNIIGNNIYTIQVYNQFGKLVNAIEENNVRSTSLDTSNLAKGSYVVVINNKEQLQFIVQ